MNKTAERKQLRRSPRLRLWSDNISPQTIQKRLEYTNIDGQTVETKAKG